MVDTIGIGALLDTKAEERRRVLGDHPRGKEKRNMVNAIALTIILVAMKSILMESEQMSVVMK